jgi:hypothetical protein
MLRRGSKKALTWSSRSRKALHQKSSDDHAFGITIDMEAAPPTTDRIAAVDPHDETSAINPFAVSLMNANSGKPV